MAKQMELTLVGMRYNVTPSTLAKLAEATPLACKLERDPDNPHDENAVKVLVMEKPWRKKHDGMPVGHVARASASVIAPLMDAGEKAWPYGEAWITAIDTEHATADLLLKPGKAKR